MSLSAALDSAGCFCRARACNALDASERPYRIAYSSPSLSALMAVVSAGLAITAQPFRHLGDQAYRDGMARRIRGKVGFQRRLLEIAHPPPEIEFPGGQPHNDLVLVGGQRSTCRAEVARHTCPAAIGRGRNGRQLVSPLDAISGPCFRDAQYRDVQIAAVIQGLGKEHP